MHQRHVEVKPLPTNISLPPDDDDTNGSGVFQISLFPGTYVVHITPDTGNLQLPESRTITITGPTTLNITLQRGVMLSGTVLGTDGITPAPEIRVEIPNAIGASDVTDGAGIYSFLAPPGIHTVTLVAADGPFKGIRLDSTGVFIALPDPATLNVTLTLSTSGSTVVQGTVFAPDGITPVPGVAVEARDAADDMIGRTFADASGNYILVVR